MSEGLRFYIHESSSDRCFAKCVHRSGSRVRPISFNDFLLGSDNATPCGVVQSVSTERIDRDNWLYRVVYVPQPGTLHPLEGFVVWRQPEPTEISQPLPVVPQAVAERLNPASPIQQQLVPAPESNGHKKQKRNKRQSVNGQHGRNGQASPATATATV